MTYTKKTPDKIVAGRDILLDFLKGKPGEWISGQGLAEQMSMTRAGIWKKIGALREEGYGIDASPRKGYRLREVPDRLLASEIRDGLTTRVMGQGEIRRYEKTDSTNRRAKELAAGGAPEGTLVVAEEQEQGRGRLDRRWFSPGGENICLSLIVRPIVAPGEAQKMILLTAVAVAEVLNTLAGLPVTIKWPNDVLVGGRKIAGILAEMAMEMDAIDYMVIGLGLNVNTAAGAFPEEIRDRATSVLAETGRVFSRVLLLRKFLEAFEYYYDIFREAGFEPIMDRWRALTDMMGKRVEVQTIGGHFAGEVMGFDPDGFLILRDGAGGETRLLSGDVTII